MRSPERREVLIHAEAVMARLFDSRRTTGANGVFPGGTSRKDTICAHGRDHGDGVQVKKVVKLEREKIDGILN